MYAVWKLDGTSSRSGPSSFSNHRFRRISNEAVDSSLAAWSAAASPRSEIAFSSSWRSIGSAMPE